MTEAMNIVTMKGKILFLAVVMAGLFAILAIAPSPADATIVERVPSDWMKYSAGNCTVYARNPVPPALSTTGHKISQGYGDVRCSKNSYVQVDIVLLGWDGGSVTPTLLGRNYNRYRSITAGTISYFKTDWAYCNEDADSYDEIFTKIRVRTKNSTTGQWGNWSEYAWSHVVQYNCHA